MSRTQLPCPRCGHDIAILMRRNRTSRCPTCDLALVRAELDGLGLQKKDIGFVVCGAIAAALLCPCLTSLYTTHVLDVAGDSELMLALMAAPFVGGLAAAVLFLGFFIYRRLNKPIMLVTACPKCGYDLRGNLSAGCPECGWNRTTVSESIVQ
jgi:predicted Zn-ribbon and HTH transcriptional regulator